LTTFDVLQTDGKQCLARIHKFGDACRESRCERVF
jgi:hypothetical protein